MLIDELEGFERDLYELFGDRIKTDDEFAKRIYAALTNIQWRKGDHVYTASFRYVGELISTIQGKGGYLDWYCCAPEGNVDNYIKLLFLSRGWIPHKY